MNIKDSITSPIRVDFIPGRTLGLTLAPGKRGPAQMGDYTWARDLEVDLDRLRSHYGVNCLVTLVEAHELEELQIPSLRDEVRAREMTSHWLPIPDLGVPADVGSFVALVRTVISSLRTKERVVLHCRGGLGRAGLVAACILIALGSTPEEAIDAVRETRPGAIQTRDQEDFVHQFVDTWRRANARNSESP